MHWQYNILTKTLHSFSIHYLLKPYYAGKYNVIVTGLDNAKNLDYPVIVVSNHYTYNDPTILSMATELPIAYIAKRELFEGKQVFKHLINMYGAIEIDRERPKPSTIKHARQAIKDNFNLGIFIEGTRNTSRTIMSNLNDGAAFLARTCGEISVLPVGIIGGEQQKEDLIINIGEPIPFDKTKKLSDMTLSYGQAIADLANLELSLAIAS